MLRVFIRIVVLGIPSVPLTLLVWWGIRATASLGRYSLSNAHADDRSRIPSLVVLLAGVQLGANACFCDVLFVLLQSSGARLCERPRQSHAARRGCGCLVSCVLAQYLTSEDVLSKIAPQTEDWKIAIGCNRLFATARADWTPGHNCADSPVARQLSVS